MKLHYPTNTKIFFSGSEMEISTKWASAEIPTGEMLLYEGDDLGWLGFFIGRSESLEKIWK